VLRHAGQTKQPRSSVCALLAAFQIEFVSLGIDSVLYLKREDKTAMSTTEDTGLVWGAYLRLSRKKSNRRKAGRQLGRYRNADESTERQLALIRAYASEHGLRLAEEHIYPDLGRGAWWKPGKSRPVRPAWDAMLAAGRAGEIGGLLVWKLDRFARDHYDGQDLIRLGVLLDGPETGRIDPSTNDGQSRLNARVEAARQYSHEISEKVNATFADMRANGYRIGGSGRLFGFEVLSLTEFATDDYEGGEDSRFAGPAAVVREDEAEVIRELARRLLTGETVQSMAADLNARGITTTRLNPRTGRYGQWAPGNLSRTLGNPLYGGKLAYKGEIITDLAGVEPILDTETFEAVQAKLGARKRGRRVGGRYPYSGILLCDNPECPKLVKNGVPGTMAGIPRSGGQRAYICPPNTGGCGQSVIAPPVEEIIRDEVLAALADVELREKARAADAFQDEQRAKLAALLADIDADSAETEAKRAATPRSMARLRETYDRNLATLRARFRATEAELAALGPATVPGPPLPDVTAEKWDDPEITPAAKKAAYIRQLGLHIAIRPSRRQRGASRGPFDTRRVHIWADGGE
jgi:DNA invertase Pin-like site-specific DNA recombinase